MFVFCQLWIAVQAETLDLIFLSNVNLSQKNTYLMVTCNDLGHIKDQSTFGQLGIQSALL